MFNRTFQIKMIKPSKVPSENQDQNEADDQLDRYIELLEHAANEVTKMVVGYFVLDTVRKVMVARANRPCCHR